MNDTQLLNLRDLYKILYRRKKIIIAVITIFIILSFILNAMYNHKNQQPAAATTVTTIEQPKVYETSSSLLINWTSDSSANVKENPQVDQHDIKTVISIAKSRTVAEAVIKISNKNILPEDLLKGITVSNEPDSKILNINLRTVFSGDDKKELISKDELAQVLNSYTNILIEEVNKLYPSLKFKVFDKPGTPQEVKPTKEDAKQQDKADQQILSNNNISGKKVIFVSTFLGLMVALGIVFVLEYLDNSIKRLEQAKMILGLPVLGEIIYDKKDNNTSNGQLKPDNIKEEFRTIRTNVQCNKLWTSDIKPKKILFTCPEDEDETSLISIQFAISLCCAGFKTLLVDSNGRSPSLHNVFDLNNKFGLISILSSENITYKEAYQHTKYDNLFVITWGEQLINPADLFIKSEAKQIFSDLGNEFDYVIFNTPTLAQFTDAQILSQYVDTTILSIMERKTGVNSVKRVKELISMTEMKILGLIYHQS